MFTRVKTPYFFLKQQKSFQSSIFTRSFSSKQSIINFQQVPFSSRNQGFRSFLTHTGLLLSLFGVTYLVYYQQQGRCNPFQEEMSEDRQRRMRAPKLTKEQAKELLTVAKELEDQGANEQALVLYRQIYYAYNRVEKASRKKMAFLSQKIGLLNATLGNYERALEWVAESYERTVSLQGEDDNVPFELYFDLCLINYKLEEYETANEMFEDCLRLAKKIYPEEKELMVLIHQFLGFGYFQKNKMELSQKHLSKALENLNLVKGNNKPFTFYACYEFAEFYLGINDSKKALLFLEQAKVILHRDSFLENGTRQEAMKIHSFYARKFLENFDKESQKFEVEKMIVALRYKLGHYDGAPERINQPYQKLSKAEKDPSIHGLLHW